MSMSSRPKRAAAQAIDYVQRATKSARSGDQTSGKTAAGSVPVANGVVPTAGDAQPPGGNRQCKRAADSPGEMATGILKGGNPVKRKRKANPPKAEPAAASASASTATAAPGASSSIASRTADTAVMHHPPGLLPPTLSFSLTDAISHLTAADPRFGRMFTHVPIKPFQPPLEAIDPFRTLVTSIIGQQVSWLAARAINGRFRALFGYGIKKEVGEGVKVEPGTEVQEQGEEVDDGYPTPEEVMQKDAMTLKSVGLSMRKAEYVLSLAEHFCSGALTTELLRDGTDEEVAKALIAVRGIGQWTVDMFLMFSLRRPDVLPVGDLGVQKGLLRWFLAAHGSLPESTKAKGKSKAKAGVKGEEGTGTVKGGKAAEAARKKYAQPATPVKAEVKREPDESGLYRMSTPPPIVKHEDGELNTLISTPPPGRVTERATAGSDERSAGGVLPPTPLTPGTITDSPGGSSTQVVQGALHTPITPAPVAQLNGNGLPQLPPTPLSPGPSRHTAAQNPAAAIPAETLEIPAGALPPAPPPSGDQLLYPPEEESWDPNAAAPLGERVSVEVLRLRLAGKKVKGGAYLTPQEMEAMTEHWKPYRSLGVYYMWPAGEEF